MKRAIVVGASSGIGERVARLLLTDGWAVGVAARREERLLAIKNKWSEKVEVARIDVTEDEATAQLKELIERVGGMDLFFYASGIGKQNKDMMECIELDTMRTNAVGFTRMIGEAFRYFSSHGGGHIAAITSIAGTKGLGPAPAYSATKAMQNTYLQALEQLANSKHLNIVFTDIRPGFVDTDLLNGDFHYPLMLNADFVARKILRAVYRRKHIAVIDWKWHLITAFWRRIPRWIWRRLPL